MVVAEKVRPMLPSHFGWLDDAGCSLSGALTIAYLTTWALWQDGGRDKRGLFDLDMKRVAELRGIPSYPRKGGRQPQHGKAMADFRAAFEGLTRIGLHGIGDVSAKLPEPLIQVYEQQSAARRTYRHAPLALEVVLCGGHSDQLPTAVLRLDAADAPIAIALASFLRSKGSTGSGLARAPLKAVLIEIGAFNPGAVRRDGRSYWSRRADRLRRVAHEGQIGTVSVEGEGPGATFTIEARAL